MDKIVNLFKDPLLFICMFFSGIFTLACLGCTVRIIMFVFAADIAGDGITRTVELLLTFLALSFICCIVGLLKRAFSREDI